MSSRRRYVGHARRGIEEYELDELLAVAPALARFAYVLAADAGLRHAEIIALRRGNLQQKRIHVVRGKGNVSRFTCATTRVIDMWAVTRWWDDPPAYRSLGRWFGRDRDAAGLDPALCLHSLRHRFATKLERQGVRLTDIQALLGHADLATTSIYLHDSPQRFDNARLAIEGRLVFPLPGL